MSHDLYLWKAPVVSDPDEADALLKDWYNAGNTEAFEPSRELVTFFRELVSIRPTVPDFLEENWEAEWEGVTDPSERLLSLHMSRSIPDEALDTIQELAAKHELILYDPQGPDVFTGKDEPAVPGRQPGEIPQAIRGGVIGLALFLGGFYLRVPFVRWVMMVVGAFMFVLAVYSVIVLIRMGPARAPEAKLPE